MIETLNSVFGGITPVAVVFVGILFAVALGGRPFTRPKECFLAVRRGGGGGDSPLRALALALAGTLGVGNIVGVSSAIALGGAGSIFWMWVSAIFALLLKYAEVVLAMLYRKALPDGSHHGGAPYYIRATLSRFGLSRLASVCAVGFALLCLINALLMGCIVQSNAVARAMEIGFSLPPSLCGVTVAFLCFLLANRGRRAVSAVTGVLVPLMSALFLALSLAALVLGRSAIPSALGAIFRDAFSPLAVGGGLGGFLTSRALRFGTIRGIISNEAGCGTSPTAHAASTSKSPVEQGILGMLEVAIDTLLLCTVTALVILIYRGDASPADDPMEVTLRAYAAAFGGSPTVTALLSLCILCFGFATLLCWSHYGAESLSFIENALHRPLLSPLFPVAFSLCAVLGALSAPALVWALTDLVTSAMTLLNLPVLLAATPSIKRATDQYFGKR